MFFNEISLLLLERHTAESQTISYGTLMKKFMSSPWMSNVLFHDSCINRHMNIQIVPTIVTLK